MNELSLFSGAGGGLLGTKLLGWTAVGYVEFNDYCQRILAQRIKDGILDEAPIFGDIRTFISEGYAESYKGMVDVITAGFPCQPFSVAGKGLGVDDPRNMWPATRDCIDIIRPGKCLLENVPGLLAHEYIRRIFGDLAEMGYDCRWGIIGADDAGAPHRRKRLWILADSPGIGRERVRQTWIGRNGFKNHCKITWWDTDPADIPDTEGQPIRPGLCQGEQAGERRGRSGDTHCPEVPDTQSEQAGGIQQGRLQADSCAESNGGTETEGRTAEPRLGRGLFNGLALRLV